LFEFISVVVLCAALLSCDGFRIRKVSIDLTQDTSVSSAASLRTNTLQGFFDLIENVAVKNGLKCNPYNEIGKYFGCGKGGLNLMTYVKGNRLVQLELIEFGPFAKTRQFEKLERDVNEMLAREFPGQTFVLRDETELRKEDDQGKGSRANEGQIER